MSERADLGGGTSSASTTDAERVARGLHDDPFSFLGLHPEGEGFEVRVFAPGATSAALAAEDGVSVPMKAVGAQGVFIGRLKTHPGAYRIRASNDDAQWDFDDPYRFGPLLGRLDEHLISEGAHWRLWSTLGAHPRRHEGVEGSSFAVWAPDARRVSVVGDFNGWDGRRHMMRRRGATGVWEIFAPGIGAGARYKYEIIGADGALLPLKADPLGFGGELRPGNCSIVRTAPPESQNGGWSRKRSELQQADKPISIYEAHLGSWRRADDGGWLSFRELAETLVPYARDMGFTHIEAMPISEHPLDDSWGYQPIGLFAPTSRHGDPEGLRVFVDACHEAGLGLILDWVPAHFPSDEHGLARFDGTALYEYADPREGFHHDWNTLIYNFGRIEVTNFLIANALYWIKVWGVDGLRVDAVASMLYRDYSRKAGEWLPNIHGGRENLEAAAFIRGLNTVLADEVDGALTVAEESTAWPGVTRPVAEDGLGFDFKWNMGWMNDTLAYMREDPANRGAHHAKLTFGFHYAFSEKFILPLSHDEVVHGKGSILGKMPGKRPTKFANLRVYYAFMWAHPGKKLLFMGQEFGQEDEWSHERALPWEALDDPLHKGAQTLVRDLNRLYREHPALHRLDAEAGGFEWIDGAADKASVLSFARIAPGERPIMALFNFSGVERRDWRFGAPAAGPWREILNTDSAAYGGGGGGGSTASEPIPFHGRPNSIVATLAPFSGVYLELERA
ncbi:MAG: 1,4-alpha-glucan branching protein GlgB [Paracoccaceae bacterium]